MMVNREEIELMDISPNQLVSVSASLIPFLENDDANRALMGSNMQRQAVPLITNEAPLVGTGIEGVVAKDSGVTIVAERDGVVENVDASRIVVSHDQSEKTFDQPVSVYNLSKFVRSNQNTCFNHRPIVRKGQTIKTGEIIADGPATDKGELALGKNVTVAFMPGSGFASLSMPLASVRVPAAGPVPAGAVASTAGAVASTAGAVASAAGVAACGEALEAKGEFARARRVWLRGAEAAASVALLHDPYLEHTRRLARMAQAARPQGTAR